MPESGYPFGGLIDGADVRRPRPSSGDHCTILTGIYRAAAASNFVQVMSPPLFLMTSVSMECTRKQLELVVVGTRPRDSST